MPLHTLLSERFDSERGLEELLKILSSVMDAFPVACFMIDTNHKVIHWNRAAEVLTSVTAQSIVGTHRQGEVFYGTERMVMADLVLDSALGAGVDQLYHGKYRPSSTVPGTFEAEDFFPHFGEEGRWLYFTAARILNSEGEVIGAIETLQDITRQRNAETALQYSHEQFKALSQIDDLTQLFNTRHFHAVLAEEVHRAKRYGQFLSLMIFDLDFFKRINDTHGHQEGDRVLKLIADQLRQWKRETDLAFRFGGDEFAVVLPETNMTDAKTAALRLLDA